MASFLITAIVWSLPEQQAIVSILSNMEAEIAALEQRLSKTCALFDNLKSELGLES